MNLTILFFGALTDAAGLSELKLNTDKFADAGSLNVYLQSVYPKLSSKQYKIAVNQEVVGNDFRLNDGDEVALLPPFAGG